MCELHIRNLGLQEYSSVFNKMREFTTQRTSTAADEIWCVQHPAVITLGANADPQHVLSQTDIPIVQSDRGGQVTYHGPGQVIIYLLVNLKRKSIGVKRFVQLVEQAVVDLLNDYKIDSQARAEAHGVYVNDAKIASLGLRVHSGCSYHGVALNVDMDLSPFSLINPCGFPGLTVTQLKDVGVTEGIHAVSEKLMLKLCKHLEYKVNKINIHDS
ncbi:MAG: lipoyl(octanoyl) transferase LipB [Gammaproteobacteria bacterium]|nr:MAG: lipoyl(octanoyl) transferase LipB [Gammaproteobacteria bacterium]